MAYTIEDGESRMLRVPKEARRGSHDLSCKMGIIENKEKKDSPPEEESPLHMINEHLKVLEDENSY
ncbi:F-box protein [Senna tora]|uniref:F-box protein n=1 Tax=Senna tora TaxID=362788 RepID=A0A834WW34_9FABA|nr:F-box protein [Senna tora]